MLKLATKFIPQRASFEQAHRAGFRCAELWLDARVLAEGPALVPLARHYPLEYVLHFPNHWDLTPAVLEQMVQWYRALGSRCLVIHQPQIDRFGESLNRLEPNLRLAVENHKLTPEQLTAWAERNPGLTLDVEHLWKFTFPRASLAQLLDSVRDVLTRFAPKLRHVHMPGYWPGLEEHRPLYCARDLVFPVLSLLQKFDFDGLIVSEVNPEFQNAAELRMDVLLFERWREKHEMEARGTKRE